MAVVINAAQGGLTKLSPRIAFFDVDGTLLNDRHEMADADVLAVRGLGQAGVFSALATVRSWFAARNLAKRLSISAPSILCAGALVVNPENGEILLQRAMPPQNLEPLLEDARAKNLYVEVFTVDNYFTETLNRYSEIHAGYLGSKPQLSSFKDVLSNTAVLKLELMAEGPVAQAEIRRLVAKYPLLQWNMAAGAKHPDIVFANVTSLDATRESAFHVVLNHLGLTANDTLCFGDSGADIPMFRLCAHSVAMGNAPESVREKANFVTLPVSSAGVAYAIKTLIKGDLESP